VVAVVDCDLLRVYLESRATFSAPDESSGQYSPKHNTQPEHQEEKIKCGSDTIVIAQDKILTVSLYMHF